MYSLQNYPFIFSWLACRYVSNNEWDHHLSKGQTHASNPISTYSMGKSSTITNHYNIRSQQFVGPQKAMGPNEEWKPKSANQIASSSPRIIDTSTINTNVSEVNRSPSPPSNCIKIEEATTKLHKKLLKEMNVQGDQHVIMPNYLQFPKN